MSWLHDANLLDSGSIKDVENVYTRVRGTDSCGFCERKLDIASETFRSDLSTDYDISLGRGKFNKYQPKPPEPLEQVRYGDDHFAPIFERHIKVCPVCGWWVAFEETLLRDADRVTVRSYAGAGTIKNLDLRNLDSPIEEVRSYLAGRYSERLEMNPTLFEQTVASVFRDLGYRTRATGCSGDGGIDVILQDPAGTEIGVQVKRYSHTIQVSQIRELTGALVLKGLTKGIFVTTSAFTSGAPAIADLSALRGHPIELIDAEKFLETLEIAQRAAGNQPDDENAPWRRTKLRKIHERSGTDGEAFNV
jgi:restriction system protein